LRVQVPPLTPNKNRWYKTCNKKGIKGGLTVKYSEIKSYTSEGNYDVNSSWEYFFEQYFKREYGPILNDSPDYQRGHVWTENQQIKYIEHILKGGKQGKNIYLNCPGWMRDFKGPFEVVDGKQRIHAVRRFLNNEIKVFDHYYREFEGRLPYWVDFVVHINDLKTREEVLTWYLEMNEGGTVHTQEELNTVRELIETEKRKAKRNDKT
jgi:hypothetical protein